MRLGMARAGDESLLKVDPLATDLRKWVLDSRSASQPVPTSSASTKRLRMLGGLRLLWAKNT